YILASGRFIHKKNYPCLVSAFAQSLETHDYGHSLVILGDGPERAGIERAIQEHGLAGRVLCPGFREYHVLPICYALADGFVHVSLAEQWGLVINEAAAAGLPLVVSRPCGAASTLVNEGENGWLVDADDRSAIAAALGAMMQLTPEDRHEMGQASARIVGDWGPDRFARGLRDAALVASRAPHEKLSMFDKLLFTKLSRLRIEKVS
ncbi:MAG: glycosyltransferase, partial [Alteraurantiacibacter sp.]